MKPKKTEPIENDLRAEGASGSDTRLMRASQDIKIDKPIENERKQENLAEQRNITLSHLLQNYFIQTDSNILSIAF